MIGIRQVIVAAAVLLTFAACDTQEQQDEFAEQASRPPSDFARTDEGGEVLAEDEDDWRTAPIYAGQISVRPAYPNPAAPSEFVTIPVTVTSFGEVRAPLHAETLRDDRLYELSHIDQAADPGAFVFNFSAAEFGSRGLHRVYIFDGVGEIVSYGDVMVE